MRNRPWIVAALLVLTVTLIVASPGSARSRRDRQAPTAPSALTLTTATTSSVSLAWTASTDNVGVAGYYLYSNGVRVGSTSSTAYTVSGLACATSYSLGVRAFDARGNVSPATSAYASTSSCGVAPTSTAAPTTSGAAAVGSLLSASPGTWSGTQPISYGYQWRRCDAAGGGCASVSGATAASYTVTTSDVGDTLRVDVTASNTAGSSSMASAPTAVGLAACQHCFACDLRNCPGASDARSYDWHLDWQPNGVRVPVAPVRRGRQCVHVDLGREHFDVHPRERRRRRDASREGDSLEQWRLCVRGLGADVCVKRCSCCGHDAPARAASVDWLGVLRLDVGIRFESRNADRSVAHGAEGTEHGPSRPDGVRPRGDV